ncbi:hypothetical protein J4G37_03620 [Microvirga sp. 3-52]|nr:hypothetical protein [Microvirga sp. 3-52]
MLLWFRRGPDFRGSAASIGVARGSRTLPPRLQAIFDAAEYLSSDDEFWPNLVAAAKQAYGAERAAEILAPTA